MDRTCVATVSAPICSVAPHGFDAVPHTRPSAAYVAMLVQGLGEARGWDRRRAEAYVMERC
ncbi:hypothetical protein [Nocardioides panzhihuensis]|uniref:Uncharacterized protein n=1 Tax=Nocardioides panzhihuensis TaxID=860243 RepID=A0A7Z0DI32_9ACTN|nr:hypothetical protein [Nocardioides panzhihuensis]NYI76000.1 hypothetical protein [Nocardioides panzhihuensis]